MEITTTAKTLLEHKGSDVWSIGPEATVLDAIRLMAGRRIGALPVLEDGRLVGIISERDYMTKVMLEGRSSKDTPVRDIMTCEVAVVRPAHTVSQCMSIVTESRVRHLPVLDGETLIGVISIGDLVRWTIATQRSTIEQLENYISGGYPG